MSENSVIRERLTTLRREMAEEKLDAYFIFGTDPHMSEYVADRWRDRAWISGFTGSAGTVVVTAASAGLWTDARYYLQAESQLEGSGITLFREGTPGVMSIQEWLCDELPAGSGAGADAWTISVARMRDLKGRLAKFGILFRGTADLLDRIWSDRPAMPAEDIFQHDTRYAGMSRRQKIAAVREELEKGKADYQFLASLSDIAWLFNLRGSDISYNPLFMSYALIGRDTAWLAVQRRSFSDELASLLEDDGVTLVEYPEVERVLREVPGKDQRVVYDPETVNSALADLIGSSGFPIERMDVTTHLKAEKSPIEVEGLRRAMVKDGAAMVQFLSWLDRTWEKGDLTELSIGETIRQFRSGQAGFIGESFAPIVGFQDHGAVIHYSATEETSYTIDQPGLLLVDSGGQYLDGTTDITRTLALGEVSQQQREDYTTVLKGHIELATAKFPKGTRGFQLDTLARQPLWERGMQYGHGTGHGVGHFLNVHEGPQSISTRLVDIPIQAGMLCSNEPGVYRAGQYGIRIENLILTKELFTTPFGVFYGFDTMTLCPYEPTLIDTRLLSTEQLQWVNDYHEKVYRELSPYVSEDDRQWLARTTAAL